MIACSKKSKHWEARSHMPNLKLIPDLEITEQVPLAPFTTWKIGGPAEYYCQPEAEQIPTLLSAAHTKGIPVTFLGRGSNVLIADEGIKGLVLHTRNVLQRLEIDKQGRIVAEAGVSMPRLSKQAAKLGYTGYEFLIGIPGTIGAGVAINAGLTVFRPREMKEIVESIEVVSELGEVTIGPPEQFGLSYRTSDILDNRQFVLRAWFKQTEIGDPKEIHANTMDHLAERKRKQPLDKPTAGSTFKQPDGGKSAGWYIEQASMKGHRVGNAMVSMKHANWIENLGGATAKEVGLLMDLVIQKVSEQFSIELVPEVTIFR